MELQGKVIAALEKRSGVSARGEWEAQDFVIETLDAYPRKMVFRVFGSDRLARFNIQLGQVVNVSFDIDAREYQGRWYTDIRAFDVRQVDLNAVQPAAAAAPTQAAPEQAPFPPQNAAPAEEQADDLPF